jgi:hypothetical protein
MQRRCGRLPGRAIDVVCNVAELNRSNRPRPATSPHEILALKQPFAACGKLRPKFMGPRRTARSAQMPLNKSFDTDTPARR